MSSPPATPVSAPRVAVIVPAYGVAHLLGEALRSLQAQNFAAWECWVIDDGAPDDVAGAVAPFLSDPRIRFLATDNRGVSCARNRAIRASCAPLVSLLDGDDKFKPDYLNTMVGVMESDSRLRLATCNARLFGAVPRERFCVEQSAEEPHPTSGSLADVLDRSFNVYIGSTFRRADFDAIGGFDETMAQSEDFDFWVRLMMLGGTARYVDQVLGDYRVRAGSASADGGRMLLGNIKVYEKAARTLDAQAPEQPLLRELIATTRQALNFEHAVDHIIDGDTKRGLAALRDSHGQPVGFVWQACLVLWQILPMLARPMLAWRRKAHSRGAMGLALFHRRKAPSFE
jgi:glycosyltransferase involved in cell wall biosynthesis